MHKRHTYSREEYETGIVTLECKCGYFEERLTTGGIRKGKLIRKGNK